VADDVDDEVNQRRHRLSLLASVLTVGLVGCVAASIPAASAALKPGTPAACPPVNPMIPVTIEQAVAAGQKLVARNSGARGLHTKLSGVTVIFFSL